MPYTVNILGHDVRCDTFDELRSIIERLPAEALPPLPPWWQSEIARAIGVSRQRVHQLFKAGRHREVQARLLIAQILED